MISYMGEKLMMMSPESYYEYCLKGKSEKEILSEIRKLKLSISRLKRSMERPQYYKRNVIIDPSEDVRIHWSREYLKKAKEALADVGGTYKPSRAELRAETFDKMIDSISKVELSIGAFTGGYHTITCTFDGDFVFIFTEHTPHLLLPKTEPKPAQKLSRGEFLFEIGQLHIGEWHTHYDISRFGYMVLDGIQWDLEIVYSDGHKPVKIAGYNSYPYNFWELISLLKADDIFAEE